MQTDQPVKVALIPWLAIELLFWLAFSLVSFVALTLFYSQPTPNHVLNILFEAVSGAMFVRPLLWGAVHMQFMPLMPKSVMVILLTVLLSQLWNLLRMTAFPVFVPEAYIWNQFGGWSFTALLIFGLWTSLFYGVRAYAFAATQRDLATQERVKRLIAEKQYTNAQLKMLRYQLNPHFIFNTLNSLNALIATRRTEDARAMVTGLSDLLRLSLERDPPLINSLKEELENARRYLTLAQMRFLDRLDFTIEADDQLLTTPVPSLILQPLVENAVRHGVEGQKSPCRIGILVTGLDSELVITVRDDGPGLAETGQRSGRPGLGLENVKTRLKSVYGDGAVFRLSQRTPKGVEVVISVPRQVPELFT